MYEFFVAKRYLRSKHKRNFITIISMLSTVGITIGVAALIIVLSVFNGFGSLVTSIMVNFDPHIRITVHSEEGFKKADSLQYVLNDIKEIKSFYPYVEGKAILLNRRSYEILNIKGITEHKKNETWGVGNKIMSGHYDLNEFNGMNKIILGLPIALRLSGRVGDTISVTSANNIERSITSFALPRTMKFEISGIFESNNKDYDNSYVFTSLEAAQNLLGMRNKISGYEIRLNNIDESDNVKTKLEKLIGTKDFTINSWYDLHKDLYGVMLVERWTAYIILCLIIAVGTFNILGSLTMSVIEKRKDIGVLRSMGSNGKSIMRIFMFEGMLVGVIGTIAGICIGLLVCYLQIKYNFYPLDSTRYIINAMPVEVRITDIKWE